MKNWFYENTDLALSLISIFFIALWITLLIFMLVALANGSYQSIVNAAVKSIDEVINKI